MIRYKKNPILTREDIPEILPHIIDVSSVFNPGAIKFHDKYLLMLRIQDRGRQTHLVMAESRDGINFKISNEEIVFNGIEKIQQKILHCYDPRITLLENNYYIMFAIDTDTGCHLGLAATTDFKSFEFLGITTKEDNRNGVLFSEKVNGKYMRFDRPNKTHQDSGPTSGTTICLSESDDLLNWQTVGPVISGRFYYWDGLIGAGPPPIKTTEGWLLIYHGVAQHFETSNIYQVGAILADLENPAKLIARTTLNILEPRELYELTGQVPNVVFPSGIIVEEIDGSGFAKKESKVLLYYGAADTSVCLATTTIEKLLKDVKC